MSRKKKKSPAEEPKKQSLPAANQQKNRKTVSKKSKSPEHLVSRWDLSPEDEEDDILDTPSYGSFLNEFDYETDLDWDDGEESRSKEPSANPEKTRKKSRRRKSKKHSASATISKPAASKPDQPAQKKEPFLDEDDDDDLTLPSYGRSHRPAVATHTPLSDPKKEPPPSSRKTSLKSAEKKPVERKSVERQKESVPKKESTTQNKKTPKKPYGESKAVSPEGSKQGSTREKKVVGQVTGHAAVKKEAKSPAKPENQQQRQEKKPQKTASPEPKRPEKPAKPNAAHSSKSREKESKLSVKSAPKTALSKDKQLQTQAKSKQESRNPKTSSGHSSQKTAFQFGKMKLSQQTLHALETAGYLEPTPVQDGVIPLVMQGKDVMGQARTGTGKTAAFLIPILEGLDECGEGNEPVALILVPTRELAVQVRDEGEKLAQGRDVRLIACYGGKPISDQIRKLNSGADIVVGTPGRILDLASRKVLSFDSLFWVVLDEADRMLDIGFRPDIEKILRQTPADRQTLLLSATLPPPVVKLAERYMQKPEVVDFSDSQVSVETIEQYYITVDRERKFAALVQLLNQEKPKQAIIFCRTKRGVDRIYRLLEDRYKGLASLHSDMPQSVRDRVMAQFRSGKLTYLVATDVIGRGIDVSGISHIINYDIPSFSDDYVHRVGRTGRMGREGVAYTLVTAEEGPELTRIEMRINRLLKRAELKGFQAVMQVEKEESPSPANKPVFGKTTRRVRRAL